jgi:hypothetical protein
MMDSDELHCTQREYRHGNKYDSLSFEKERAFSFIISAYHLITNEGKSG